MICQPSVLVSRQPISDFFTMNENIRNFSLRKECLRPLLLQRTKYQSAINLTFRRIGLGNIYEKYMINIIEIVRINKIENLYYDDIKHEFNIINRYLPKKIETILDIGGGLCGIDVFLYNEYKKFRPHLYVIDRNEMSDKIFYFYEESSSSYNDFDCTRKFLMDNGVPEGDFTLIDINTDEFPEHISVDLVISLISWRFHYPIDTYLDKVRKVLSTKGNLILDLRKDRDDINKIKDIFSKTEIVDESRKHLRIVATK